MFPMQAQNLTVQVKGKVILGPLDLELPQGGITVILGPNGAGKTSLLKAFHGIMRLKKGHVSWQCTTQDAAKKQAFVFQTPTMLRRSVLENLCYPLQLRQTPKDQAHTMALSWAKRIKLQDQLNQPATRLSGGEQQKLALARALICGPQMLFLDEPTASLDGQTTRDIEQILVECAAANTTLLMSTHNIGQAKRLANRIIFLHHGRIECHMQSSAFFDAPPTLNTQKFIEGDIV